LRLGQARAVGAAAAQFGCHATIPSDPKLRSAVGLVGVILDQAQRCQDRLKTVPVAPVEK
jgi:hypothetical protein